MEATPVDPAILAVRVSQEPPPAPVAPPQAAQELTPAQVTAHLATIGVTGVEKRFACSADAKTFVKEKLFLRNKGFGKGSPYCRFMCNPDGGGCEFGVRLHVNLADEAVIMFQGERRWHSADCARCAKGMHGLSMELRAAAVLNGPRRVVEEECKRVMDADPLKVEGEVHDRTHTVNVTKRQLHNVRKYENKKDTAIYADDPDAFFEKAYPGSRTTNGTFDKARVVCGIRPYLVSRMLKQDQICVDATYWVAPKDGNVCTIGFTEYDSFVPVFFAVFEPPKGEKCTESGDTYRYVFQQFENLVRTCAGDYPSAVAWVPRVAVRDHACAIRNGMRTVFANCEDFICYFHVKQALEQWLVSNQVCEDLKKDMHRVMESLHFSTDMDTYLLGLRVAQETLVTPLWGQFFAWNSDAHRMPGQPCERWSLAYSLSHDTTTNCGIERWHKHLKTRVREGGRHTMGHLGLRDCAELMLKEFAHVEALLKGVSPRLELPLYFEKREDHRHEDFSSAKKRSVEYLHVLQKHAAVGQTTFRWKRLRPLNGPESVVLVDLFTHGVVIGRRDTSWASFLESQAIHITTREKCSCIAFQTNAFLFCKHVLAVQAFMLVCPVQEVPAATPPRTALCEISVNSSVFVPPASTRARTVTVLSPPPFKRSRSRSRAVEVTPEPPRSFHRPAPRSENSLQRNRSADVGFH